MVSAKMLGVVLAAFAAGAFLASPELGAYASTIANDVICTGCVGTSDLATNAVTSVKIKNGEVNTDDIAGSAVTNAKLTNGAVNSVKIADNSITEADIGTGAVTSAKLANDAVNFDKIADDSITEAHIRPNTVGASELQGVTKLVFMECVKSFDNLVGPGSAFGVLCNAPGIVGNENAVASHSGNTCFAPTKVDPLNGSVQIYLFNRCQDAEAIGTTTISIIVYDT